MEDNKKSGFGLGILTGLIIGVLFSSAVVGGFILAGHISQKNSGTVKTATFNDKTLKKINTIKKLIDSNLYEYSEEVSADNIEEGIFQGMIKSLGDDYAEYISSEKVEEELNDYEGVSYGIGCYVSMDDNDMPQIYGVFEESPAEKAGVREGDIIISVDGESVRGLSLSQVVDLIKGNEGTDVLIEFSRGDEFIELTVTRGKLIETPTVSFGLLKDDERIGYIRIKEFGEVTVEQYEEAINDLREEGIKGLILDIRSNPGGALNAAVGVARQILPEGIIVYTEDKNGVKKEYTCDGQSELDLPLVVLINQYSASASEIIAGSIKDYNKGTLVGTQTYGKGIVQSLMNVGDGSMIKLTTSAYFTPSGNNIQGIGINPDIELEYDYEAAEKDGTDNQVNKAMEILQDKIGE